MRLNNSAQNLKPALSCTKARPLHTHKYTQVEGYIFKTLSSPKHYFWQTTSMTISKGMVSPNIQHFY